MFDSGVCLIGCVSGGWRGFISGRVVDVLCMYGVERCH